MFIVINPRKKGNLQIPPPKQGLYIYPYFIQFSGAKARYGYS
uniref:Uncharacterized protein n=1 Tax=Escherichia coli TaxID=562 RepID=A0A7L8KA38_ECOLX|nr:hypothetical protein [Escherichia coli]